MHDIAEFLRTHSPFDSLDKETLAKVAESAEIEFYAARTRSSTAPRSRSSRTS